MDMFGQKDVLCYWDIFGSYPHRDLMEQCIINLANEVRLNGRQIRGQKEGKFYYLFPNGTEEYAGLYRLDIKEGLWKDYDGEKLITSYYENGICQNFSIGTHLYIQQEEKNGKWIEICNDQIKLITIGNYKNNLKNGTWQIFYDGINIGGGNYNEEGQKIGEWIEPVEQFGGCYNLGLKMGHWKICDWKGSIGGGHYNCFGLKTDQWVDPHKNFGEDFEVVESGEYKNGFRIGEWKTSLRKAFFSPFKIIGGGSYDSIGKKSGKWIVLESNYRQCKVTYTGQYKSDIRIGKWRVAVKPYHLDSFQYIGGGNYNNHGEKSGFWTDVYKYYSDKCEVTFFGQYKNGLRIGKWKISNQINNNNQYCIGGGIYNENGLMEGNWIDLDENYTDKCPITQQGEYKNGIKIGQWQTLFENIVIESGKFNEINKKHGQWIETLDEKYQKYYHTKFIGQYENGIRTGHWIAQYQNKQVGGGIYNSLGQKQGFWTDPYYKYNEKHKLTYSGQYYRDKRIGKWIIKFDDHEIGGGNYDDYGKKYGQWIDADQKYYYANQLTYLGKYENNLKIGYWETQFKRRKIGGGFYPIWGKKDGLWIEMNKQNNSYLAIQYQFNQKISEQSVNYKDLPTLFEQQYNK